MKRIVRLLALNLLLVFLFVAAPVCVFEAQANTNGYHFAYLNAERVHEESTGKGVVVAVIDSGVTPTTSRFKARLAHVLITLPKRER